MNRDYGSFYKSVRAVVRLMLGRFQLTDGRSEEEKRGPVVYVSHHQNLFGPVSVLCWYPEFVRPWIYSVFMEKEASYRQYVDYTFTERFGWNQTLAELAAWPASRFVARLTRSGQGIPVYRQSRAVVETMKESVAALKNGESVLLFPDVAYNDDSPEVKNIYDGFLYIEKYYFRETGKHIPFVPVYSDKEAKEIRVGTPILFAGEDKFFQEKQEAAEKIQQELNRLAASGETVPVDPEQPAST